MDKAVFFMYCKIMFLFMIKKTFFNYWDNFIQMFLLNFGYLLVLLAAAGCGLFFATLPIQEFIQSLITIIISLILLSIYNGAVHGVARDIADDKNPGFKDFFKHLKNSWHVSLFSALLFSGVLTLSSVSIILYTGINFVFNVAAMLLLIFFSIILVTASQYFLPIYYGLDKRFLKIIKKMFLIFFDNILFSFSLLIFSIIILGISTFTIWMVLGPGFVSLLLNVGLKLRLYKYDYLEKNPDSKKIPWEALLIADREKVGQRTLRGMIFPWKE